LKAFPNHPDAAQLKHLGMDLRDWFAGLAMQGELASQDSGSWDDIDRLAQYAYAVATAMMKERNEDNE
jgi:hypothetical protein